MKVRISQATIVDSRHQDNGKVKDILIVDGQISKIADKLSDEADEIIEAEGLCVSIGWMDMRANFCDPGNEVKEDIDSGLAAAANGGFTSIALSPDTTPKIDSKSLVKYTQQRGFGHAVSVVQIGCLSKNKEGKSLAEMYDMFLAGAHGFGDEKSSLKESGLLQRALLYTKSFGAPIFHFPYDASLIPNGQINEGTLSTQMGLKGMPAIAEEMVVRRDLTILEYTEGKLHIGPVSSAQSVDLISDAKQHGLQVSCETTAAHIAYEETILSNFDTLYKLLPPLRNESNRSKLLAHLKAGAIDIISSDHTPEDEENKKLEFDFAHFGQAAIETFFPTLWNACVDNIEIEKLVATFSTNPRTILGIDNPEIKEGMPAELTLFSISLNTEVNGAKLKTKAYNVLPNGMKLKGKVIGIVSNGQYIPSSL